MLLWHKLIKLLGCSSIDSRRCNVIKHYKYRMYYCQESNNHVWHAAKPLQNLLSRESCTQLFGSQWQKFECLVNIWKCNWYSQWHCCLADPVPPWSWTESYPATDKPYRIPRYLYLLGPAWARIFRNYYWANCSKIKYKVSRPSW